MDRVAEIKQSLERNKDVALRANDAGPSCARCRYRVQGNLCGNPALTQSSYSPHDGAFREFATVHIREAREGVCGEDGLLFDGWTVGQRLGDFMVNKAGKIYLHAMLLLIAFVLVYELFN